MSVSSMFLKCHAAQDVYSLWGVVFLKKKTGLKFFHITFLKTFRTKFKCHKYLSVCVTCVVIYTVHSRMKKSFEIIIAIAENVKS